MLVVLFIVIGTHNASAHRTLKTSSSAGIICMYRIGGHAVEVGGMGD